MKKRTLTERLVIQILHIYLLAVPFWYIAGSWIGER